MRSAVVLFFILSTCWLVPAGKEPQYLPPLASGGAPDCPEHVGLRQYKSEIAKREDTSAYIEGAANREASGCQSTAVLHVQRGGATYSYALPEPDKQGFSIADFSPDASMLLLFSELHEEAPNEYFRNVQLTTLPIVSGEMHWRDVWDIFQWHDCDATVEPQGFSSDGTVIIRAGPSVMNFPRRRNCLADVELFAVNLQSESLEQLSSDAEIKRYGSSTRGPWQTCKGDPDLAGACFTVHGRMSLHNGTPTIRIWRIGTDRILGVHDFIVPESIASKLNWDNAAYGDFYVCPFTRQTPEAMQIVCVESASKVIYKKW
jgi:hypothetical protein